MNGPLCPTKTRGPHTASHLVTEQKTIGVGRVCTFLKDTLLVYPCVRHRLSSIRQALPNAASSAHAVLLARTVPTTEGPGSHHLSGSHIESHNKQ